MQYPPALFLLFLLVPSLVVALTPEALKDQVHDLPGVPRPPTFNQFSGFVAVDNERFYHYWLVESQNDPSSDPLVLWLNGGPGCSSLLGFLKENGPWTPSLQEYHKLIENPYSWNKNATVIYLESPSPVGFSYGGNLTAGDDIVSHDNYFFLQGFLKRFPQFANHEFYITGESYAGQYIPQLAHKILTENDKGENPKINLQGFMVGNPSGISSSDWEYSSYKFYEYHGLLATAQVNLLAKTCNYSADARDDDACRKLQDETWNHNLKGVDPYNILAPCVGNGPGEEPGCFTQKMEMNLMAGNAVNGQTFVPCGDYNHTLVYLNSAQVKAALHIPPSSFEWTPCSEHLTYNQYKPGTPQLYLDMVGRIRMMVYSGDIDSCVPFLGTRKGVESLGLARTSDYTPWFAYDPVSDSLQIAGYTEDFKGVSFTSVRGAGHMVPWDKPPAALSLLNSFIHPKTAPLVRSKY